MLVLTSKPALIALLLGGMLAHGIWITTWAYLEIRGRVQTHTFLDTQLTYLVIVVIQSFTLGQLGPPQVDKPNFLTQLGQPNWQVVLFALSSGACIALGDLLMQTAGAQLGVAVGPAIIFAVGIAGGVVLSFFLDKGLNTASLLFTGGGCALAAVVFGALAHIAANKHVPVFDISRDGSRSYRHARVGLDPEGSSHGYQRVKDVLDRGARRHAELSSLGHRRAKSARHDVMADGSPDRGPSVGGSARACRPAHAAALAVLVPSSSHARQTETAKGLSQLPVCQSQLADADSSRVQHQTGAVDAADESTRGYWRALQALELAKAEDSLAERLVTANGKADESLAERLVNTNGIGILGEQSAEPAASAGGVEMSEVVVCTGSTPGSLLATAGPACSEPAEADVGPGAPQDMVRLQGQHSRAVAPNSSDEASHAVNGVNSTADGAAGGQPAGPGSTEHGSRNGRSGRVQFAKLDGDVPVMPAPSLASFQTAGNRVGEPSKPARKHVHFGFAVALIGGVLYALLLPLYNLSVNDSLHSLPPGVPSLAVYCAFFYVAISSCGLSLLFAPLLLHYPVKGAATSTVRGWLGDNYCRAWCVLAGICLWVGDLAQFMGGQGVGFGIAYVLYAAPLVSTILGIVLFGEFRDSSRKAQGFLAAQVVLYAAAIGFLIAAANTRK